MSDRAHLRSRVVALQAELRRLEELFDELPTRGHGLPWASEIKRVVPRLYPVFAKEIHPMRKQAAGIEKRLSEAVAENKLWEELESLAYRMDPVVTELLFFMEGALARAAGLDAGLCAVVDRLLDFMAGMTVAWGRTAIPAAREQTSSRTWIIGVRIPDTTIWSLPLMVHELGHFAAKRLEDGNDEQRGKALLSGKWINESFDDTERDQARTFFSYSHAFEFFSDVFGSYVLGPAYVAANTWRATPHGAWEARGDHPAWGHRVAATVRVLEKQGIWDWVAKLITPLWAQDLEVAGVPASPPDATGRYVDAFVDEALQVLEATAPTAQFRDQKAVLAAGEKLVKGKQPTGELDPRTVLNAAWVERLRGGWDQADLIADTAFTWYRRFAGVPVETGGAVS